MSRQVQQNGSHCSIHYKDKVEISNQMPHNLVVQMVEQTHQVVQAHQDQQVQAVAAVVVLSVLGYKIKVCSVQKI